MPNLKIKDVKCDGKGPEPSAESKSDPLQVSGNWKGRGWYKNLGNDGKEQENGN